MHLSSKLTNYDFRDFFHKQSMPCLIISICIIPIFCYKMMIIKQNVGILKLCFELSGIFTTFVQVNNEIIHLTSECKHGKLYNYVTILFFHKEKIKINW
jgi:hypothetical protein